MNGVAAGKQAACIAPKRILELCCRRRRCRARQIQIGGRLLSDIRPEARDTLSLLDRIGPVVIYDSKSPRGHRLVVELKGETDAWTKIGICVVSNLSSRVYDHVRRQPVSRNARRLTDDAAEARRILENIRPISEVHVSSLNSAMFAFRTRPSGGMNVRS